MCFDSRLMAAQAASAYRSIACRGLSLACCSLRSQQHRFTYNEPMPVESCTQSLCDLALRFGEDSDEAGMVSTAVQHLVSYFCSCLTIMLHDMLHFAGAHAVWRVCGGGGGS
jgi:hypothetical protein